MVTFAACSTLEASDNDPNQVGTVSVKFDRAAGACDISINYSGERYKQSIPVSSDPASSLNRLSMLVDKHPIDTTDGYLSLIHISEPTRRTPISYAVFCLKKKK